MTTCGKRGLVTLPWLVSLGWQEEKRALDGLKTEQGKKREREREWEVRQWSRGVIKMHLEKAGNKNRIIIEGKPGGQGKLCLFSQTGFITVKGKLMLQEKEEKCAGTKSLWVSGDGIQFVN